jgi:hypothetical protein
VDVSATTSVTSFVSRYVPADTSKDPGNYAARALKAEESALEDDVRNKRCDDIIQNDKSAVARAASVPGATSSTNKNTQNLDVYL